MTNTILLVSHKIDEFELTSKFLKLGDFETITCSNSKEALRILDERYNDIALILLDPTIEELIYDKFLTSVKSDERYKHILVKIFPEPKLDKGNFPFPSIFKPPKPPDDLALSGEPKTKEPVTKQVLEYALYCKHCGAELPKGEAVCHVCGKKVR